jgi:ribosomal protein S11
MEKKIKIIGKDNLLTKQRKFRQRLLFRKKFTFLNTLFQTFHSPEHATPFTKKLNFRVAQNNVFCTMEDLKNGQIIEVGSAGKYKIKVSKKTLRYNSKMIIGTFLRKVQKRLQKEPILLELISPSRMKKPILKQIFMQSGVKTPITIQVKTKKCFNGCRPKKKRRKKRTGLRIFK